MTILLIALIVMSAVILAFVFVPLARGSQPVAPRELFARGVYRDQLSEIARDVERGLADADQAEATRREIERRLLSTAKPEGAAAAVSRRPVLAAVLALAVCLVAGGLYALLGTPGMPDMPFADRAAERSLASHEMPLDLDKAVAGLEAKLAAKPDDADGWLLLGRTEAARNHWQKSADAMRHAMILTKNRPDIAAAYGEILVMAGGGIVTPTARDVFAAVLAREPDNAQALWYLGLAAAQGKNFDEARSDWQRLLKLLPADGEDRKLVSDALDALNGK